MEQQDQSVFKMHSIAYSAVNKKRESWDIEVILVESAPFTDGEISDNIETFEAEGTDAEGKSAFNVSMETTGTIQATWFPLGNTNRKTPPDIRRGEPVIVFKLGDADKYYWVEYLSREKLRRLETVIWAFSNEREENKEVDHDNSYWMVVSTHDKHIRLHTSNSDQEPFIYDIEINTKEGTISITDDVDNYIFLNSKEKVIRMHNTDKSFVEVNKTNINLECRETVSIKCKDLKVDASSSITTKTKTFTNTAETFKLKAGNATITATTKIVGNTTIDGNTVHNGNTVTNGNAYEQTSSGPNNMK